MADVNGNNNLESLAEFRGQISPNGTDRQDLSIVDSVGLFETFGLAGVTTGDDYQDYFTFLPSGLSTINLEFNHLSSGTYANLITVVPTSGVSSVSGTSIATWTAGSHRFGSTLYSDIVNESAAEIIGSIRNGEFNYAADLSQVTYTKDETGAANAVWVLDGSPVTIEIVGYQLNGNDPESLFESFDAGEIFYNLEITAGETAFNPDGGGGIAFLNNPTYSEIHTGSDAIDIYRSNISRDNIVVGQIADGHLAVNDLSGTATADTLINVERIELTDGYLALDTDGNAGQIYRLYQAAFDREPDLEGLGHWINTFDNGVFDLVGIAEEFLTSTEFETRFGTSETLGDDAYLRLLYANVLDRTPDQPGFDFWSDQQEAGLSRADMLRYFSESEENYQNVAASISDGIYYV